MNPFPLCHAMRVQTTTPPTPEGKTRTFAASLLGYIMAPHLWEGGGTEKDVQRPVWLAIAGSPTALKPIVANLRLGETLTYGDNTDLSREKPPRLELMKSAGYRSSTQVLTPDASVVTFYHPAIFDREPWGDNSSHAVVTVPTWWAAQNPPAPALTALAERLLSQAGVDTDQGLAERVACVAPLAAYYLDARTNVPLPPDPAFQVALVCRLIAEGACAAAPRSGYTPSRVRSRVTLTQAQDLFLDVWTFVGLAKLPGFVAETLAAHKPSL